MQVGVSCRQGVFLLAGVLTVVGCTSGGAEPPPDAEQASSQPASPSPTMAERPTAPIGTGSGEPAPLVSGPAVEATVDLSSPEVAADWMCSSVRAAPDQARAVVFERLREEAVEMVGDEAAVDAAVSRACGEVVDPLR